MASPFVATAKSTTIAFATSAFTSEIIGADLESCERVAIDTTHFGTTAPTIAQLNFGGRTFIPGDLADPGELVLEVHFNADKQPPVNGASETITITCNGGAIWTGSGFIRAYNFHFEENNKSRATLRVKLTGIWDVTIAP